MESLADHEYNGIDDGTKVPNFPQGIRSTMLEAAVSTQPVKYGKDFDSMVPSLGQMVTKKGYHMQFVQISKTGSHPTEPKLVLFIGKIECKKHFKTDWNNA